MSVASKNPFALLDEDGGPTPPAPEPVPPSTNQPPTRGGQRGARGRGGPGPKGGKYYQRGGGARTSAPREGGEDDGADDSTDKKGEFVDGARGKGRGRGRGRGDREGSRGGGRRTYDRHSATGKTDSEKKIHQSWGGDEGQTELATETAAADDAAAEQAAPTQILETSGGGGEWGAEAGTTDWGVGSGGGDTNWGAEGGGDTNWGAEAAGDADWAAPAPASTTNAEEPAERSDRRPRERQEEEPDNTLTLDQYIAQQKEKSPIVPPPETRKVEQDESLWKGAVELVKGAEEDTYFVGKTKSTPKARTKKEEKVYLEIEARFERPSGRGRGRGGDRGDRGGDRGGRERSSRGGRGGRGRSNGSAPLNVDDESAFPSLS